MPRHARFMLARVPVHVIQRGHNRAACFFAAADYGRYLDHLQILAARFDCAVHAYCLMTNHVHLLLTPTTKAGCALVMKHLAQAYAQYVNRRYRRSGTLWEGRFRSCLTDSEGYLLACSRYIELNPVRAGMVRHPRDYPWSSYRCNAEGRADGRITPHECYLALAGDPAARRGAYRALCRAGLDAQTLDEIRLAANGGFVLGNRLFQDEVARRLGRRVTRGKPGRPATAAALARPTSSATPRRPATEAPTT
jgi:putative transposase